MEYPCDFTMKIVGENEGFFVEEIVSVVAEACEIEVDDITYRTKVVGKWTSVTVQAPVKSSEMLYMLYEKVRIISCSKSWKPAKITCCSWNSHRRHHLHRSCYSRLISIHE